MGKVIDLDMVQQLSLAEKAELVSGHQFWYTASLPEHNIPALMMSDGPSGLRKQAEDADALGINESVDAISYPVAALTASSFDRGLLKKLGKHLGIAARSEGVNILLGPGINIKRSPLAGRNFEYFSEDPYLAGQLGQAYVDGVQNEGVGVSVKHFAANNRENQRFTNSSDIVERPLREIYLSAFENVVKNSQPATIMNSYNALNGVLVSQNKELLTNILRHEWNYKGAVISDWGAVADRPASIRAGLDLEMPGNGKHSTQAIIDAVNDGTLEESQLDCAVERVLGLLNKWYVPKTEAYDKAAHHDFAQTVAEASMVLLKNDDHVLPLQDNQKIAFIGVLAETPRYQGGGSSHVNAHQVVSPLEAAGDKVTFAKGYDLSNAGEDTVLVDEALRVVQESDVVVYFAGFPEAMESEGYDKTDMDLPQNQINLMEKIAALGKPVVVVLQNGSAVAVPWRHNVSAILETYLAGEAVGSATWRVLTGVVNPSGKLAETFPERLEDNPTFGTFNASKEHEIYHEGIFVGYRYYDLKHLDVAFPFGHGLSYTDFSYDNLQMTEQDDGINVTYDVTNSGSVEGSEATQIYISNEASQIELAPQQLQGFEKVTLQPGETKSVTAKLGRRAFSWFNVETHAWQVDNGQYTISVGSSSRDIRLKQTFMMTKSVTHKKPVTMNTYFAEIVAEPSYKKALEVSGLGKTLDKLQALDLDNAQMMLNIPLRAYVMLGIEAQAVEDFIAIINEPNHA